MDEAETPKTSSLEMKMEREREMAGLRVKYNNSL